MRILGDDDVALDLELGELLLERSIGCSEERSGVAHVELAPLDQFADLGRQFDEAQQIADGRT